MILSLPVNPLAARIALIVASVPELTIRIISIDGTQSLTSCASSFSLPVGAPKVRPSKQAFTTSSRTSG